MPRVRKHEASEGLALGEADRVLRRAGGRDDQAHRLRAPWFEVSVDLPEEWSVNDLTGDPRSIATDEAGVTIDVYRRGPAADRWPYHAEPARQAGEAVRVRLIPYHQWANRGPATMRTWIPAS